ncbi:MAG: hypothetical protein ACOCQG_01705 [Candidatus Nanoarchaeia archaeon]
MIKKPFQKKSQGLSLNTVVIAALVVLVLVILAAILMGRFDIFTSHLKECPGECKSESYGDEGCPSGYEEIPGRCEDDNEVCCAQSGAPDDDDERWTGHPARG